MGFYDKHILPRVLNRSCGAKVVQKQRRKVVPLGGGGSGRSTLVSSSGPS